MVTYLRFYRDTPEGRAILRSWAKKSGKLAPTITAELAKAGLPTELVWQALVESGHNPSIRSPAGAAGLWQFMPETARSYGLIVDRWVDERLDPQRSTEAAVRFLGDLQRRFGNWELALAAYNMGDAGLARAVRKYNTNDFYALTRLEGGLPWETALYVPRIVALAIAMANRDAFGIAEVQPDPAQVFDTVLVGPGQPLASLARAIGMPEGELVRQNPQFLAGRTPPALGTPTSVRVHVPDGMGELATRKLARSVGLEPDLEVWQVRRGDTPDSIARSRGVSLDTLRQINRLGEEALETGSLLLVPRTNASQTELEFAEEDRVVVVATSVAAPPERRRVFYRVVPGDTLSGIARSFGVSRSELLSWNPIDPSARLQSKMVLEVWLPTSRKVDGVAYLEEKAVRVLVAGSAEFADYFEALRGNERVVVEAKANDTLASIGARYGVSPGSMERINRRSRSEKLTAGEAVVVYVRRGHAAAPATHPVTPTPTPNGAGATTVRPAPAASARPAPAASARPAPAASARPGVALATPSARPPVASASTASTASIPSAEQRPR